MQLTIHIKYAKYVRVKLFEWDSVGGDYVHSFPQGWSSK